MGKNDVLLILDLLLLMEIVLIFSKSAICMERPPLAPPAQNTLTREAQYLSPESKTKEEGKSFKAPAVLPAEEQAAATFTTASTPSIPSNVFVYRVVFINKHGVPEAVEKVVPIKEVPAAVFADESAKVKFILTKLLKGEGIDEKPNLRTYFPTGADIVKCEVLSLPSSEEGTVKKLYLEFTPDVVKDIDENILENIHKQVCFTLKESGIEGFSVFEFRVRDEKGVLRSLGYFIKRQ